MTTVIESRQRPVEQRPWGAAIVLLLLAVVAISCSSGGNDDDDDDDDIVTNDDDTDLPDGAWWRPTAGTTWHWQLTGDLPDEIDAEMVDIDLLNTHPSQIATLQDRGHFVVCYFSAGTREEWRDDASDWPAEAIGKPLPEWPDEQWVDVTHPGVREILATRLDIAVDKGCDGVEPDNVDGYDNDTGLEFDYEDQLDFNRWMAAEAHNRGLSVGLKNALDQVEELHLHYDWALNEECVAYDECAMLHPFIADGKPVFHSEYVDERDQGAALAEAVCSDPQRVGFSTLIKTWDLDAWGLSCP